MLIVIIVILGILYFFMRFNLEHYSPMDLDDFERERIRVYMGGLDQLEQPRQWIVNDSSRLLSFDSNNPYFVEKHPSLLKHGNSETIYDLMEIHRRFIVDTTKLVHLEPWADSIDWHAIPTIVKARHMHAKTIAKPFAILMRLRSRIHFGPIREDTIAFGQKKNKLIWRGGPSGPGFHNQYSAHLHKPSREDALRRWALNAETQDEIDMGLTAKWRYKDFVKYVKPELSIPELLEYKYILSIEGNDVATNLKWALASNSVILMPLPRVESWFAESLLKPYVHFVPVRDDFSDLYTQKKWCDANPKVCIQITQNAQSFVRAFRNLEREYYLSFKVLQTYMHWVKLISSPHK